MAPSLLAMARTRARPLLLHVDDDEAARAGTARVLQAAGFQVALAETGAEGLSVARARLPDLVVLDVELPDLDGLEVCRRLRGDAALAGTPVLLLSGARLTPTDKVTGLEGGADAYLGRPVEPDVLVATVRALLRVRRAEEQTRRLLRRLQRTERAREDALAAAWSAVNEPLSAIEIAGAGLRAAVKGDVVGRERLASVLDGATRVRAALQALLELARAEARPPLDVGTRDARALLERSRASLEAALQPARAVLVLDLPPAGAAVRCDERRLGEALGAALGAAAPWLRTGERVTLAAEAAPGEVHLVLAARDAAAAPWPAAGLEPFWTARSEKRRGASALLSLTMALVGAQGGRVWVEEDGRALHLTVPGGDASAGG